MITDLETGEEVLGRYRSERLSSSLFNYFLGFCGIAAALIVLWVFQEYGMMGDSGLFIVVFIGGAGLYLVLEKELKIRSTEYIITDRRVIKEHGVLREKHEQLWAEDINDMNVMKAFIGGLTGTRTIGINFEGWSGNAVPKYELEIADVSDYEGVESEIAQVQPDVTESDPDEF